MCLLNSQAAGVLAQIERINKKKQGIEVEFVSVFDEKSYF